MFDFVDRRLTCRECGQTFTFSAGEQQFFHAKGLQNDPSRCMECRLAHRARTIGIIERPARELHMAVCAECGGEAKLPFEPRHDKPVYCSSCYDRVRAAAVPVPAS